MGGIVRAIRWTAAATSGWVRPCVIAALVLIGWSGRADATCGDYLHVGGMAAADSHASHPLPGAPRPCRGPGCREGNRHAPLAPTTPVELHRFSDHLLTSVADGWRDRDVIDRVLIEARVSSREGFLLEVNRPPKQA